MWRGDSNSSRRWLSSASASAPASLVRSRRPGSYGSYRRSRGPWGALSLCLFHWFREVTGWIHMSRMHRDTKSCADVDRRITGALRNHLQDRLYLHPPSDPRRGNLKHAESGGPEVHLSLSDDPPPHTPSM